MRQALVQLHRCLGLALAAFLLLAGVTGALLAFSDELEALTSPELFLSSPASQEALPLDPLLLRERVAAAYPHAEVTRVLLAWDENFTTPFRLRARPGPQSDAVLELPNDEVFIDPYSGEIRGERRYGDITQGMKNLMPFIFELHHSLALHTAGRYVLGVVSLVWIFDCFIGAWLTFPARAGSTARGSWLARWRPAWSVRWRGGGRKLTFDLHRAGGLWPWLLLLFLAWSSIAFNLREVYDPVMRLLFTHQAAVQTPALPRPLDEPPIDWWRARELVRAHMDERSQAHGFTVRREHMLAYDAPTASYDYYVQSDRDVSERWGSTRLSIDARTGEVTDLWIPTGVASGDTADTWITTLHMAAVGGRSMQIFMVVLGLAVAMLSLTGIVLWLRKRGARLRSGLLKGGRTHSSARASDSIVCESRTSS